mgnify:CR=1 FL=1
MGLADPVPWGWDTVLAHIIRDAAQSCRIMVKGVEPCFQPVGRGSAIRIGYKNVFPSGMFQPQVSGAGYPLVDVVAQENSARIGKPLNDVRRGVRGGVVNDYQFKIPGGLREYRLDAVPHRGFLIIGCNDDRRGCSAHRGLFLPTLSRIISRAFIQSCIANVRSAGIRSIGKGAPRLPAPSPDRR